jgi:hypothetical protein
MRNQARHKEIHGLGSVPSFFWMDFSSPVELPTIGVATVAVAVNDQLKVYKNSGQKLKI